MNDDDFTAPSPPALDARAAQAIPLLDKDPSGVPLGQAPNREPEEKPQSEEKPRYHYVLHPLQAFHVYEETTGQRITHAPLTSEHEAEQLVRVFNRNQAPPV